MAQTSEEFFCHPSKITNWAAFLEAIRKAGDALKLGEEHDADLWFRGHSSCSYKLQPSLFRCFPDLKRRKRQEKLWAVENDLYWEFWAKGKELHGVIESDWDILFAMQHYQTPTRLLDWTETLGVAVYFATLNVGDKQPIKPDKKMEKGGCSSKRKSTEALTHPSVWVLNPYAFNRAARTHDRRGRDPGRSDLIAPENLGWRWAKKKGSIPSGEFWTYSDLLQQGKMFWTLPRAIYPQQRNPRLHAQRAWFTIHGNDLSPIEDLPNRKKYALEVPLPFEVVPEARQFLTDAGIDHYLLFADLPHLSLHLQEKNGLITRAKVDERVSARL
jgi:hypothetical protein